ncbi:cupin domain-containing protein [Streptomyces sp. NPDC007346]|uniref:cupin domain-containing protein n=1 Tax=Streptomyces sp. NPDC007346 TaxID=3154682 RepID=UPI00345151A4
MNVTPRVLAVLNEILASALPERRGALWHLAEAGRELDANLVRLPAGAEVGEHQEDVLDVFLVVLEGGGRVRTRDGGEGLEVGASSVVWLPRTSRRALVAGPDGLTYLTVHRRRPGMAIKAPTGEAYEGGEGPCMLDRVCPECGRLSEDSAPVFCSRCGERFPER